MLTTADEMPKGDKPAATSSDFLHDYLQKTDLSSSTSLKQFAQEHRIARAENESDEAFTKRVKKINYLNLAQQLIRHSTQSRPMGKHEPPSPIHVRLATLGIESNP